MKTLLAFILLTLSSTLFAAQDCPMSDGRYGNGIVYQNIACRFFVNADKTATGSRNVTVTDAGLVQFFSNFPGTTNSNSTGARVYYLFPMREKKKIIAADKNHLSLSTPSGVQLNFDENGRVSSPDLKMTVSKDINSTNKGGVEIASYPDGIVIDIGYRMGASPTVNMNGTATVTDKNGKKCSFSNSELNKKVGSYDAELIYKTNEALHGFLTKKCPTLDLSDLKNPATAMMKKTSTKKLGSAPTVESNLGERDTSRKFKESFKDLDSLIESLEREEAQGRSK